MFVGIEITRRDGNILLSQKRYIRDILGRFDMQDAKEATSPTIDVKQLVDTKNSVPTKAPYREAVGALMYLANCTRPDLLFTVNYLARYNQTPTEAHWKAVKHIFRYLKHTQGYSIKYERDREQLEAYSDADWASQLNDRHSTSGVLLMLGGGPIIFSSRNQSTIAQSSTEAEYVAANEAVKEIAWVRQLLDELRYPHKPPALGIDNHSTIKQIQNSDKKRRSKHIELKYHYIRQQLKQNLFSLKTISSDKQPADILTKPLSEQKLKEIISVANILTGIQEKMRP